MAQNKVSCGECHELWNECQCASQRTDRLLGTEKSPKDSDVKSLGAYDKKMEMVKMEQEKINWSEYEMKIGEDRLKLEVGTKYELGFCSLKPDRIEVVDKERTAEGQVEVKKQLPVLILGIDLLAGKPVKKELMVTSKKLVQTIKTYFERDMLFTRVFQLEKAGAGYQTTYQLIALQDKPKDRSKDVEAFI